MYIALFFDPKRSAGGRLPHTSEVVWRLVPATPMSGEGQKGARMTGLMCSSRGYPMFRNSPRCRAARAFRAPPSTRFPTGELALRGEEKKLIFFISSLISPGRPQGTPGAWDCRVRDARARSWAARLLHQVERPAQRPERLFCSRFRARFRALLWPYSG